MLLQPIGSVLGWLHIKWAGPSAAWTGLCCKHPWDRLPQPLFVLSSGIATATFCSFLWNPLYMSYANAAAFFYVHFPGLTSTPPHPHILICRQYLPVLKVSGEVSLLATVHSMSFPVVLHCEDVVSIELVVVFPWFGNRSQEAIWPVFGNTAFVETSLVDQDGVQLNPILFC